MLDTEAQWSEALVNNNIRAIICWIRLLPSEGDAAVEDVLLTFSCWVQRTSEFAKKELLTLCFSRCQGLWMFLDQNSFTRLHMLLQRMKNLLTLAQWARKHLSSVHLWHGVGVPCVTCRDGSSTDVILGCWSRARRALKQHIWLGQLVEWWGIMGLLPKTLDGQQVKLIDQMWKDMKHSHQNAQIPSPKDGEAEAGSYDSLIEGMVMQLNQQHGRTWISQPYTEQCFYPPPNLQALLELVLLPHVDNISVQAILMYFTLDVMSFLQCKDDLLQAFCHAFTIPQSFSRQIRAFWMFDHGHVTASMELLLSPSTTPPSLQWQHRYIINKLLMRKEPRAALKYLKYIRPPQETGDDSKLFAQVLLQCSCVSESWLLLKRSPTLSEDMMTYFFQACEASGLCTEAIKYIPAENNNELDYSRGETTKLYLRRKEERPPCPFSATLKQAQTLKPVSSEDLMDMLRKAVMEIRKPHPRMSCMVWPVHIDSKAESREKMLSTQTLRHFTPSPSLIDKEDETQTDEEEEPQHPFYDDLNLVSIYSFTSASSFPPVKPELPYMYERTLILQRISSLLTDGEDHEGENQSTSDSSSSQTELSDSDHPDTSFRLNVQFDICSNPEAQSVTDILSSDNDSSERRFGVATLESSRVSIYQKHCDSCADEALSDCFLDKEQTAKEEERSHGCFIEDLQPTTTKTHQRNQQSSGASPWSGGHDISSLCSASSSQTHCLSSDAVFEKPQESFHTVNSNHLTDPNTLPETLEASGGFLSAPGGDVYSRPDIHKPSFPSPSACGLLNLDEFTVKERVDNKKQGEKVELAGWTCLGKVSQQGAIRGRGRARKGKRLKRI